MSDVNLSHIKVAAIESNKQAISFNKKNQWKSVWEKTQMGAGEKPVKASANAAASVKANGSNAMVRSASQEIEVRSMERQLTNNGVARNQTIAQQQMADKSSITANKIETLLKLNSQPVAGVQVLSSSKPDMNSKSYLLAVTVKELLEKNKIDLKVRNISVIPSEQGVTLVLRDYTAKHEDLEGAAMGIKSLLGSMGVEVEQFLINGVSLFV